MPAFAAFTAIAMIVAMPAFLVFLAAATAFITAASFARARTMTLILGALFHFFGIIDDVNRFIVDGRFFHFQRFGFGFGCARAAGVRFRGLR